MVRKTDETPPRVSVIDVAAIITGHNVKYAAQAIRNIYEKYPDLDEKNIQVKFANSKARKANRGISSPGPAGLGFSKRRSDSNSEPLLTLAIRLKMGANQPPGASWVAS